MMCQKCKSEKIKTLAEVDVTWNEIYRKKKCLGCGRIFYTSEFEVEPNERFMKEWALYGFKAKK